MLEKKQCVIVLGMHRSGTSALTGVLSLLGIEPGDSLMPAVEGNNSKGFWEHAEIVSIHDQLLETLGSSWDDENVLPNDWWLSPLAVDFRNKIIKVLLRDFNNQPIWLIKDPRMCRLLPLWRDVLRELTCQPLFIIALRNPAEVAFSLLKRDNLAKEASYLLWLSHMLEAEYQTRGCPRAFINYERLLSDWRGTMTDIGKTLRLSWPNAIEDATLNIEAFLDPTLRHHTGNAKLPDHPTCHLAREGFNLLSSPSPDPIKLDFLRAEVGKLISLVVPWSVRLRSSERYIRQLHHRENLNLAAVANLESEKSALLSEKSALRAEIFRVKNTVSWQITKPLRLFAWIARSAKSVFTSPHGQSDAVLRTDDYCAVVPFGYLAEKWSTTPNIAVICHMFYIDTLNEFARHLSNIPFQFDLYITTDTQEKQGEIEKSLSHWKGKIEIRIAPNRGRDIGPMLITCRDVFDCYEYILHIHTKKSPHLGPLSGWRSYLLETLIGSTKVVESVFEAFRSSPNLGIIAPQHFEAVQNAIGWGKNFKIARALAHRMGIKISQNALIDFPSGSMFWARSVAIKPLLDCNLTFDDFPDESGQLDATHGHAIERLFFFACERAGYGWIKIGRADLLTNTENGKFIENRDDLIDFINNSQFKLIE